MNFRLNLNKFKTSKEFSMYMYNILNSYAKSNYNSNIECKILYIRLYNNIIESTNIYLYPYINKDIPFDKIFKESIIRNNNILHINILLLN